MIELCVLDDSSCNVIITYNHKYVLVTGSGLPDPPTEHDQSAPARSRRPLKIIANVLCTINYIYIYIYIHTCRHIHTSIYVYVCVYHYIIICIYIYIYTERERDLSMYMYTCIYTYNTNADDISCLTIMLLATLCCHSNQ